TEEKPLGPVAHSQPERVAHFIPEPLARIESERVAQINRNNQYALVTMMEASSQPSSLYH
ncbi:MAG: hypothetical protein FWE94_05270, partial [Coriobacteriia bacterium]|nr:hypothetical protein [Coriobacteriia bacterium]